jgi:hypothetical protein
MKQIFKSKQSSIARMFKTTALVAVLASTLMAAAGAEAAVLITDVLRRTIAGAGNQGSVQERSEALSGAFDKRVDSQDFLDAGLFSATATQSSTVDAQEFAGFGTATFSAPTLNSNSALSAYRILFTLTDTYVFSGFATFTADQNPEDLTEKLVESDGALQKVFENGPDQDIFDSRVNDTSSVLITLLPGEYELNIATSARGFNLSRDTPNSAQGSFDFRFSLTEVVDVPPNNVPEPGSLALAMAGLAAIAVARKKKAAGESNLEARDQGSKNARAVAGSYRQIPGIRDIDSRSVFVD